MIKRILKKEYIVLLVISFIFILMFSASTSPLYSLIHSYYNGFDSAEAMVVAKGWLNGLTPYKDLYTTNGPLMVIINTLGWMIGKRYGLMIMEWIVLTITLILIYKLLRINQSKIVTYIAMFFTLLVMFATINNGNNEQEYLMLCYVLDIYLYARMQYNPSALFYVLLGLSTGIGITISPLFSIPLICISLIALVKTKNLIHFKQNILYYLVALLIPVLIISIYLCMNGTFSTMLYANTVDRISKDISDTTEIWHKLIKILPFLLVSIIGIVNRKKDNTFLAMMIIFGITMAAILMIADISWNNYYLSSLCIPLCFASKNNASGMIKTCYIFIVFAIFWTPIRNYIEYTFFTDMSGYEELLNDLNNNLENNDATFYGINTPSFFYLETNTLPSYPYFTRQTDIQDEDIYDGFYHYLVEDCQDEVLIYKFSGFVESEIGSYDMETIYYQNDGNYAIYIYSKEKADTEE